MLSGWLRKKESRRRAHLPPKGIPDKGRGWGGREALHQAGANLRRCVDADTLGGMNLRWIGMLHMRSMFNMFYIQIENGSYHP